MIFKFYPLAILLLGLAFGIYVYNINPNSFIYELPFLNLVYDLPVAVYFVVVIYIVFLISILFIFSERFSRFMEIRGIQNDKKTIIKKIKNRIIEQDTSKLNPKTEIFKEIDNILDGLEITPKPHYTNISNNEIKKLFAMLENLKNGEEIDVYKFNIPQTSALFTQNVQNSINRNYKNGLSILKNKNYIYELKKFAFIALLKNADSAEIMKYKDLISIDREVALAMLEAYMDKKISLSIGEIIQTCQNAKFTNSDYLSLAKNMKGRLNPSEWVRLFEHISDGDENAENAYFYVLFELEMLEEIKTRLKSQSAQDFLHVRAYLDLKNNGKKYPIELFF